MLGEGCLVTEGVRVIIRHDGLTGDVKQELQNQRHVSACILRFGNGMTHWSVAAVIPTLCVPVRLYIDATGFLQRTQRDDLVERDLLVEIRAQVTGRLGFQGLRSSDTLCPLVLPVQEYWLLDILCGILGWKGAKHCRIPHREIHDELLVRLDVEPCGWHCDSSEGRRGTLGNIAIERKPEEKLAGWEPCRGPLLQRSLSAGLRLTRRPTEVTEWGIRTRSRGSTLNERAENENPGTTVREILSDPPKYHNS